MLTKIIGNKEYKLVIEQDETPDSPRNWDNLGTLVTAHRSYLGDEELPSDAGDIDEAFDVHLKSKGLTIDDIYYHKVYLYEHGEVRVSVHPFPCNFDSNQWGYIYTTDEVLKKEGLDHKGINDILDQLTDEIRILDQYYKGDIYMYTVESREFIEQDGKKFYEEDWCHQDSCSGFYGGPSLANDIFEYVSNFTLTEIEQCIKES